MNIDKNRSIPTIKRKPANVRQLPETSPLSMSSGRPSGMGLATMNNLLCLLGDLDRQVMYDSALTVSRYETTGGDLMSGMPAWSSSKSFKQISKCNSPGSQ